MMINTEQILDNDLQHLDKTSFPHKQISYGRRVKLTSDQLFFVIYSIERGPFFSLFLLLLLLLFLPLTCSSHLSA